MTKLNVYSGHTLWLNGNMHRVLFFRKKKKKYEHTTYIPKNSSLRVRPKFIKKGNLWQTAVSATRHWRIWSCKIPDIRYLRMDPIFLKRWHWLFYCSCATTELKTPKMLAGFAFVITDQRSVNLLQECEEYVEKLLIYSLIQGLLNIACINSLTCYTCSWRLKWQNSSSVQAFMDNRILWASGSSQGKASTDGREHQTEKREQN